MGWAGHVARAGKMRNACRILIGNVGVRDHLGDLDVDGRIILKIDFREVGCEVWTDSAVPGWGPLTGFCEYGYEPSSFINGGVFCYCFSWNLAQSTPILSTWGWRWARPSEHKAGSAWIHKCALLWDNCPGICKVGSVQTYNGHIRKKIADVLSKMRNLRINVWPITKCFREGEPSESPLCF